MKSKLSIMLFAKRAEKKLTKKQTAELMGVMSENDKIRMYSFDKIRMYSFDNDLTPKS